VDEYVQAALISLEREHLDVQLRLVPGADVFSQVFASIDTNTDGVASDAEKQAYARCVLRDLTLSMNGQRVTAEIVSTEIPSVDLIKEGLGEIRLAHRVPVTRHEARQTFVLENHHQRAISAYLVNSLKPRDPSLRIVSQHRNADQSRYELEFEVSHRRSMTETLGRAPPSFRRTTGASAATGTCLPPRSRAC
jgi:hypothetical protein